MTILVVDDNEQNCYQLQVLLTAKGYQVVTVGHGAAALAHARQTPPDLIISDILMPTMDGFALCREWKKDHRLQPIPFIFYTATYTDDRDREFALSLGAERFLVKPQEPDVLVLTIEEVLNQVRRPAAARPPTASLPAREAAKATSEKEADYLQQYNEALIRKLESKMQQLERVNRELERNLAGRKRAEEELRKSNQDLQQAMAQLQAIQNQMIRQERLNALGQMAAGIVHDFNNALVPIVANAEFFLAHPPKPTDQQVLVQGFKDILKGGEDAKNIVYRLREFYRPREKITFQPVDLGEVIKSAMELTRPRWQDMGARTGAVMVNVETPADPVYVNGHESELREALTNLILNAVDAMPKGGTITLRCRQEEASVIVEVSDTGTGMTPEVMKHCFEPFFSTKGTQGTGLGLAMVYGIVRRHRGTVTVESEHGRGTTFRIILSSHRHPKAVTSDSVQAASRLTPLRILLMEDDAATSKTLTHLLNREGHYVQTVQNGMEGIQVLWERPFDVVITDRILTGMSGDEVAKTVKELHPNMSVIMLTGFSGMLNSAGKRPPGVDAILGKPAVKEELIGALKKVQDAKAGQDSYPG